MIAAIKLLHDVRKHISSYAVPMSFHVLLHTVIC